MFSSLSGLVAHHLSFLRARNVGGNGRIRGSNKGGLDCHTTHAFIILLWVLACVQPTNSLIPHRLFRRSRCCLIGAVHVDECSFLCKIARGGLITDQINLHAVWNLHMNKFWLIRVLISVISITQTPSTPKLYFAHAFSFSFFLHVLRPGFVP